MTAMGTHNLINKAYIPKTHTNAHTQTHTHTHKHIEHTHGVVSGYGYSDDVMACFTPRCYQSNDLRTLEYKSV